MTNKEKVLKRLIKYATMFGANIGNRDFFLCWEDTDRERNEDDDNIVYFPLSVRGKMGGLGDAYLTFVYNKQTKHLKLIVEHYANDSFVVYEHNNFDEMTTDDDYDLVWSFNKVAPYFISMKEIMRIDTEAEEQKKYYYKEIERVVTKVFGWDN